MLKIISQIQEDNNYEPIKLIFDKDSFIINSESLHNTFFRAEKSNCATINLTLHHSAKHFDFKIYNRVLVLNIPFSDNYGHILHDIIPKLLYYDENSFEYDAVFTAGSKLMHDVLKTFDISFKRISFLDFGSSFKAKAVKVENHLAGHTRDIEKIRLFKNHIERYFLNNPSKKEPKTLIYYSRSGDSSISNARRMETENEIKIIELLQQFAEINNLKFCLYNGTLENGKRMPLIDQMNLFRTAKAVVGPHGSGLANLIFLDPDITPAICEFTSGTQKIVQAGPFINLYYLLYGRIFEDFAKYYAIPFTEDSTPVATKVEIENLKIFLSELRTHFQRPKFYNL